MKVVIIHGNGGGTGDGQWIPWLTQELRALGVEVANPTMPDNFEAKMNIWLPYMEQELHVDKHTIVVGWSSGAVAAMRYTETHQILGSVLIGACYTDLGDAVERISGYYNTPWNWLQIQKNQQWIMQFASIDDPFIPIEEGRFIHTKLGTEYQEFQDRGHFGCPHDMFAFPELLEALKQKIF